MGPIKGQLALAFANLNIVSKSLGEINDLVEKKKCPMLVDEYFYILLTLEKVNEAIGTLEKVDQGDRKINNRF